MKLRNRNLNLLLCGSLLAAFALSITWTAFPSRVFAEGLNSYKEATVSVNGIIEIDLKDCADKVVVNDEGQVVFFVKDSRLEAFTGTFRPLFGTQATIDYGGTPAFVYLDENNRWQISVVIHPLEDWDAISGSSGATVKPLSDYFLSKPESEPAPVSQGQAESPPAAIPVKIVLDGQPVVSDAPPYIDENERTMVPVRFIGEGLGAEVGWDEETETAELKLAGSSVYVRIGSRELIRQNKDGTRDTIAMDTVAVINSGRAFVPLRFIAESLGLKIGWDPDTMTASLTSASD